MSPEDTSRPRHMVALNVVVQFDGTYYTPDEMVGMCDSWIEHGLEDRDNVSGYRVIGAAVPVSGDVELAAFQDDMIAGFNEMRKSHQLLCALQEAGVDNWDGMAHAYRILEEHGEEYT